jgi:hypothetical protein
MVYTLQPTETPFTKDKIVRIHTCPKADNTLERDVTHLGRNITKLDIAPALLL